MNQATVTLTARSAAAERMRRHRERRRKGLRCLMVLLRETEIDALICQDCSNRKCVTIAAQSRRRFIRFSTAHWAQRR